MTMTMRWQVALLHVLLLAVMLIVAIDVGAQAAIIDPTRPPGVSVVVATARGDGGARGASTPVAAAALPQLQAIQLPREAGVGASAMVDGRVVRTGERVGEHTVVAIDAASITLRAARGTTQTLSLLSGVTKSASATPIDTALATSNALAAGNRKDTR